MEKRWFPSRFLSAAYLSEVSEVEKEEREVAGTAEAERPAGSWLAMRKRVRSVSTMRFLRNYLVSDTPLVYAAWPTYLTGFW